MERRRSVRVSVGQGLAGAALVVMGLAGGAWAGIDAARQVDARYREQPEVRVSVPVPAPVSRWEPAPAPEPVIAAPTAGSVWGQEIGRGERAFFDPTVGEEAPAVRVHHLRRERARLAPEPDAVAPIESAPAEQWAEPPADTTEPEQPLG